MQFLKTLFWVVFAVALVLFGAANWANVTVNLWGGLQADVKLPVLVFAAFLAGFLPMFAVHHTRLWSLRRRMETQERSNRINPPVSAAPVRRAEEERTATDSQIWPTA